MIFWNFFCLYLTNDVRKLVLLNNLLQPHGEPATSLTLLRRARKLGDTRECAVQEFTSLNPLGKESRMTGGGGGGGVNTKKYKKKNKFLKKKILNFKI